MNPNSFDEAAALETFEQFLFEMDQRVEALQEAAVARGFTLDMTVGSLNDLEAFLEEVSRATPPAIDMESLNVLGGRYLGEVVCAQYGGKWELPLSDRSSVNFNQPVIVGHSDAGAEFAPISVAGAFLKKNNADCLRGLYRDKSRQPKSISRTLSVRRRGSD